MESQERWEIFRGMHLGLLSAKAASVLSRLLLPSGPALRPHERKQKFLLRPRHGCSGVAHVSWHAQLPHVQVTPHILVFNCYSETKISMINNSVAAWFLALRTWDAENGISWIINPSVSDNDPPLVLTALRFLYDKDFYLLTGPMFTFCISRIFYIVFMRSTHAAFIA